MGEPITITITADEDDLRGFVSTLWPQMSTNQVAAAIAAALPKPRIHPQPGDLLRRRSDGSVHGVEHYDDRFAIHSLTVESSLAPWVPSSGLDPAEWDIVRVADIPWPGDRS